MEDDAKISGSELLLCVIIAIVGGCFWYLQQKYNETKEELNYYKTIVENANNIQKRDSIVYNIQYKDSTIVRIKKELKYETEYIKNLNDTESVAMFNKLVWSD